MYIVVTHRWVYLHWWCCRGWTLGWAGCAWSLLRCGCWHSGAKIFVGLGQVSKWTKIPLRTWALKWSDRSLSLTSRIPNSSYGKYWRSHNKNYLSCFLGNPVVSPCQTSFSVVQFKRDPRMDSWRQAAFGHIYDANNAANQDFLIANVCLWWMTIFHYDITADHWGQANSGEK